MLFITLIKVVMKKFCFINYCDAYAKPFFLRADNLESVYQFIFDNEMLDFDYEGVDKDSYTLDDIYKLIKDLQIKNGVDYRPVVFEINDYAYNDVPHQVLRWNTTSKTKTLEYDALEISHKTQIDLAVEIVKNTELKRNAFEKFKEINEYKNMIEQFKKIKGTTV